METLKLSVDGEDGYTVKLETLKLTLRKKDRHVRMDTGKISSVRRGRGYRYSKTFFYLGCGLAPVFGVGLILLAIYYRSGHEILIMNYRKLEYALSADATALGKIEKHIGKGAGA